jgi:iron complex transport system substrate-binding protein
MLNKGISYEVDFCELGECIMVEFDADFTGFDDEVFIFRLTNNEAILDCVEKMEKDWTFKISAYRNNCFSLLYKVFYILERARETKYMPPDKYKIIEPAILYLKENYSDSHLKITDLAKQANISPSYFRRIFSNIFLMPPAQYLRNIRISKAKELLLTDGISVTDVSNMVGYSSLFYFDVVFKKETGMTPTEYIQVFKYSDITK